MPTPPEPSTEHYCVNLVSTLAANPEPGAPGDPAAMFFSARSDQTLLQAAEAGGYGLPSSCRNGTCRTCLCRLQSGQIRYLIEWPGVSQEERSEGYFLPCVSVALSDLVVVQPLALKINVT